MRRKSKIEERQLEVYLRLANYLYDTDFQEEGFFDSTKMLLKMADEHETIYPEAVMRRPNFTQGSDDERRENARLFLESFRLMGFLYRIRNGGYKIARDVAQNDCHIFRDGANIDNDKQPVWWRKKPQFVRQYEQMISNDTTSSGERQSLVFGFDTLEIIRRGGWRTKEEIERLREGKQLYPYPDSKRQLYLHNDLIEESEIIIYVKKPEDRNRRQYIWRVYRLKRGKNLSEWKNTIRKLIELYKDRPNMLSSFLRSDYYEDYFFALHGNPVGGINAEQVVTDADRADKIRDATHSLLLSGEKSELGKIVPPLLRMLDDMKGMIAYQYRDVIRAERDADGRVEYFNRFDSDEMKIADVVAEQRKKYLKAKSRMIGKS